MFKLVLNRIKDNKKLLFLLKSSEFVYIKDKVLENPSK